jgi:hypothetical protein
MILMSPHDSAIRWETRLRHVLLTLDTNWTQTFGVNALLRNLVTIK